MEVAAILRSVSAAGGFATVIRKGEADRGSLLLLISSRGRHHAALERVLTFSGDYVWQRTGPAESGSSVEVADFLAKRARFDPDLWAIELDIVDPERFIAETIVSG